MTDATPPPDEPLDVQARTRIRAELLAMAQARSPRSPRARRWVVPATAAASVALVAGMTAWAAGVVGGGDTDPGGTGPAGDTSASTAPDDHPSATPAAEPGSPTSDPDSIPSDASSEVLPAEPTPDEAGSSDCQVELEHVLKGAEQVAAFPKDDGGTTSYWVRGDRFVLCDERAGRTTVHKPLRLEPDLDDVATFRVSSRYSPTQGGYRTVRVAGGPVPEGALAFDLTYRFPDGHTEQATKATDDRGRTWWRMVYEYDDGGGNETRKPPIEVTVTLSGIRNHFVLEWGTDTCAQANHGC